MCSWCQHSTITGVSVKVGKWHLTLSFVPRYLGIFPLPAPPPTLQPSSTCRYKFNNLSTGESSWSYPMLEGRTTGIYLLVCWYVCTCIHVCHFCYWLPNEIFFCHVIKLLLPFICRQCKTTHETKSPLIIHFYAVLLQRRDSHCRNNLTVFLLIAALCSFIYLHVTRDSLQK